MDRRDRLHTQEMRAVAAHLGHGLGEMHQARQRLERLGRGAEADWLLDWLKAVEAMHERLKAESSH